MLELRAGVIGAGVFGGHHARKYAGLPGVRLTAVYDPHLERVQALASGLGAVASPDMAAFLQAVDVVTVATPAATHADLALLVLRAGKSVLVEKPLATTLEHGQRLVDAAATAGVVLACGLQERLVAAALGLFDLPEPVLALEAVRLGPWSPRGTEVSCVLDLTIHDLDLAAALARGEPVAVEAEGRAARGEALDEVRAEITFADGLTATVYTSRVAEARERRLRLWLPSGEIEVDFLTRAVRNTTPFALTVDLAATPAGADPLGANVAGFLAAVRGEASRPPVTGIEALRALDLALAVEQAAGG